jgi:hypothetical protein
MLNQCMAFQKGNPFLSRSRSQPTISVRSASNPEIYRYQNLDDLLLQAFQLLDDWEKHSLTESPDWIASTRIKVDAEIASIAANGGNDGETAISQLLDISPSA